MSEKDSETFAGMDEAAKAMKEKLESIFSTDDPDEASPEDRTARPQIIGDIAYELAFGGEEAMREPKGPFDTSLTVLRYGMGDGEDFEAAIRVLEDWPKWEPLIEAAGKVDKKECLEVFNLFIENTELGPFEDIRYREDGLAVFPIAQIRALLEALPEKEEKK